MEKLLLLGNPLTDVLFKKIIDIIILKGCGILTIERAEVLNNFLRLNLPMGFKDLTTVVDYPVEGGLGKIMDHSTDRIDGAIVFPGEFNTKRDLLILMAFADKKAWPKILLVDWTRAQLESLVEFLDLRDKENDYYHYLRPIIFENGQETVSDLINWLITKNPEI